MDYLGVISRSIEYIENNIMEELTLEEIAKKSFLSPFHFHRIFSAFTGFSVMEYIRKRKLNIAVLSLKHNKKTILETAIEFGYGSNESFSRAVQKEFGCNPSEIKRNNNTKAEFNKLRLWGIRYTKEHGLKKLNYEIVHTNEMHIVGYTKRLTLSDGENYIEIPKIKKVLFDNINNIQNKKYNNLNRQIGIALTGPMDLKNPFNNRFIYFRGFEIDGNTTLPDGFEIKIIPPSYCGKFYAGKTIKEHSDTLDYVYGIWLHENNFELAENGFDFMEEIIEYDNNDKEFYFYIPIKNSKKSQE